LRQGCLSAGGTKTASIAKKSLREKKGIRSNNAQSVAGLRQKGKKRAFPNGRGWSVRSVSRKQAVIREKKWAGEGEWRAKRPQKENVEALQAARSEENRGRRG